jgi:prepilin-type N-terminal cleavage/methylation domain-containing protein
MFNRVRSIRSAAGFSAMELMMTISVMGIVAAMAAFQIGNARPSMKGDGAMRTVLAQLNTARELSITQRRQMQVNFINGNEVQIVRRDLPAGTTEIATIPIEGGIQFRLLDDIPDTPDAFGKAGPVDFGTAVSIAFTTDGTLVNQSGAPVNGTIFLGLENQPRSARAVTVLGATGRIRGFKWDGARWVRA